MSEQQENSLEFDLSGIDTSKFEAIQEVRSSSYTPSKEKEKENYGVIL